MTLLIRLAWIVAVTVLSIVAGVAYIAPYMLSWPGLAWPLI